MFTLMTGMRERQDDDGSGLSALMFTLKEGQKTVQFDAVTFPVRTIHLAVMTIALVCADASNGFFDKRQKRERKCSFTHLLCLIGNC